MSRPPYSYAGLLEATEEGFLWDSKWQCTAQFVDTNILLTSAHCVNDSDSGEWYKDVKFFRAYEQGQYAKEFYVECMGIKQAYVDYKDGTFEKIAVDYAALRTKEPTDAGHFGLKPYQGERDWESIGYPINFDGGEYLLHERVHFDAGEDLDCGAFDCGVMISTGHKSGHGSSGGAQYVGTTATLRDLISVHSSMFDEDEDGNPDRGLALAPIFYLSEPYGLIEWVKNLDSNCQP